MPAIATTLSLSNYSKINISTYHQQMKQAAEPFLDLSYQYRGKPYNYTIQVSKTPCNYGGYRHWFLCPSCSKRTSVLYCAGLYVCRHCIGANYHSQLQQPIDRLFNRAESIRQRLEWQSGIAHGNQGRPKGMHFTTYYRLVTEHDRLTAKIWQSTLDKLGCTSGG